MTALKKTLDMTPLGMKFTVLKTSAQTNGKSLDLHWELLPGCNMKDPLVHTHPKAIASCSKCPLCEPSQKGLFFERPQRQKETISLPCKLYTPPFLSTTSKSPSTFNDPLLLTVIFVVAILFFLNFYENAIYTN